jgi:prophage regulatory protein
MARPEATGRKVGRKVDQPFDPDSDVKLLSLLEVQARGVNFSKNHIYRLIRQDPPGFPAPIHLGANRVAWIASEIDAWLAARIAERDDTMTAARERHVQATAELKAAKKRYSRRAV